MSVIENFAALSAQEQREFADALIKTINSESTFSSEVNFEITNIEADDISGCLFIEVSHADTITVDRPATWTCLDEDDAHSTPEDADYTNSLYEDTKKSFKTNEAIIDGYRVILNDVVDVDEEETIEVEVEKISHEDDGIGSYEYWGEIGYDSQPYVEVKGTITAACTCLLVFEVEVVDNIADNAASEDEEN
jgi:hypothetical protein